RLGEPLDDRGGVVGSEAAADAGGRPGGLAIGGPDRLEVAVGVGHVLLPWRLPADHARGPVAAVADHGPLARERVARADRDLHRAAARAPHALEVGEHAGELARARELAPALLAGPVEALALEGAEQQQVVRAVRALVLDRTADRDQAPLRQPADLQLRPFAPQRREDRPRRLFGSASGPLDRLLDRHAAVTQPDRLPHGLDVALVIAAVTAREPPRLGEAVARLPGTQRRLADAGPVDDVAHSQVAHAATRSFASPSRTRLFAVPCGTPTAAAISPDVSPAPNASTIASRWTAGSRSTSATTSVRRSRSITRSDALGSCVAESGPRRSTSASWTAWLRQRSIARLRASIVIYERNEPRRSSNVRGRRHSWAN